MSTHEQIPSFLAEMPERALASYLNPGIMPKPLPSGMARVMPWRDELLPTALQEYVRDIAERTQCPPDFVGVALVVAVSTVVGRKFTIHPKQHDDWMVVPNQWGVIIGRPSAMKTPALKQAMLPLRNLESRERERYGQAQAEHNGSFTYDRIGRGTIFIESCCLSLIGGIQPSRIASLVNAAVSGELDDGLTQRLQLAVYPDDVREWRLVDRWPNTVAAEHVEKLIDHLDRLPSEPRIALRFSPEAQEKFNVWYTDHMQQSRSEHLHASMHLGRHILVNARQLHRYHGFLVA